MISSFRVFDSAFLVSCSKFLFVDLLFSFCRKNRFKKLFSA